MPKINNSEFYPTKSTLTLDDRFIGSDSEDNEKTKNFNMRGVKDLMQSNLDFGVGGGGLPTGFYQEGTFTPVLVDAIEGSIYTFTVSEANYIRVGNVVNFNIVLQNIETTGIPSNVLRINGLPFDSGNTLLPVSLGRFENSSVTYYSAYAMVSGTAINFYRQSALDGDNNQPFIAVTFTSGRIDVAGSYITNTYTP